MKITQTLLLATAGSCFAVSALANPYSCTLDPNYPSNCYAPVTSAGTYNTNRLYVGLSWEIGRTTPSQPDLVIGVRSLKIKDTDSASGVDANMRWKKTSNSYALESTRLSLVTGKTDTLFMLGAGYSHLHNTPLMTGGVQLDHIRLSTDYLTLPKTWKFHGEINTLSKPRNASGTASCEIGTLTNVSDLLDPINPENVLNGQTCRTSVPG